MDESDKPQPKLNKISISEMGTRAHTTKSKSKAQSAQIAAAQGSILDNAILQYHPKTDIQHQYYSHLLQYLLQQLGDIPSTDLHELAYNLIMDLDVFYPQLFKENKEHYNPIKQMIHYLADEKEEVTEMMNVDLQEVNDNDLEQEIAPMDEEDEQPITDVVSHLRSLLQGFSDDVVSSIFSTISKSTNPLALENQLIKIFNFENTDIVLFILENLLHIQQALNKQPSSPTKITDISQIQPTRILDFSDYVFKERGHFQANKNVKLPDGSFKRQKQGYEEIHIPMKPHEHDNTKLVPISQLPSWMHPCFPNIQHLNTIQTRTFASSFESNENMLISAPTGAGKTNISLLAMLRLINEYTTDGVILKDHFKIIYVAPLKALVQELVHTFGIKLKPLGLVVGELTGDVQMSKQQIKDANLIITTPEKWDVVTRKYMDPVIKLLIIDEVHLLHDARGPVIESIITRSFNHPIRLIALSATLPNYMDVAQFLKCSTDHVYYFDASYRPCPLQQEFIGITTTKFKRLELMNEIVYEKIMEDAGQYQVITFVHSRKETLKTAQILLEYCIQRNTLGKLFTGIKGSVNVLEQIAIECENTELKKLIPHGFGIHHAGLSRHDRTLIEDLFADKHLQVLVATSTLAVGINLPSHTCIIKGTKVYNPVVGQYEEIGHEQVLQMIGRAGRPGYDVFGRGVVITDVHELPYYLSILNSQFPIESQLFSQLENVVNSEIVNGNITNLETACAYLQSTYLYTRMMKSPKIYNIPNEDLINDIYLLQHVMNIAHTVFTKLQENKMISYSQNGVNCTELGKIASYYYINYNNMAIWISNLKPHFQIIDILRLFSMSDEFKYMPVRKEEELELNKLIQLMPIPINEPPTTNTCKINILLQCFISNHSLRQFALQSDLIYISQSASRLFRALSDVCLYFKWFKPYLICLDIYKMTSSHSWSLFPLNQIHYIPQQVINKLNKKNINIHRLMRLNQSQMTEILNNQNDAALVTSGLLKIPKYTVNYKLVPLINGFYKLFVSITNNYTFDQSIHFNKEQVIIVLGDALGQNILFSSTASIPSQQSTPHECQLIFQSAPSTMFLLFLHSTRFFTIQSPTPIPCQFQPISTIDPYQNHLLTTPLLDQLSFLINSKKSGIYAIPLMFHLNVISMISNKHNRILLVIPVVMPGFIAYINDNHPNIIVSYVHNAHHHISSADCVIAMHCQLLTPSYEVLLMNCANSLLYLVGIPISNYMDYVQFINGNIKYSINIQHNGKINHVTMIPKHLQPGTLVITEDMDDYYDLTELTMQTIKDIQNGCNYKIHPHLIYSKLPVFNHVVIMDPIASPMLIQMAYNLGHELTLMGHSAYLKQSINGFPIESELYMQLGLLSKTTEVDVMDGIGHSYMKHRLIKNIHYYADTDMDINAYCSRLIEETLEEMNEMELIKNDQMTGLGKIMEFYKLQMGEMDIILMNTTEHTTRMQLIEIISHLEYHSHQEDAFIMKQINQYLKRQPFDEYIICSVLKEVECKLHAIIQVGYYRGHLKLMMTGIEVMQMMTQQIMNIKDIGLQIPHYDAKLYSKYSIKSVYDLMELDDDVREELMANYSETQKNEIADYVNKYPNVDMGIKRGNKGILVEIDRDDDIEEMSLNGYFIKQEHWWLIIGNGNSVSYVKKIDMKQEMPIKLEIEDAGTQGTLYLMCDGYVGCDQIYELSKIK